MCRICISGVLLLLLGLHEILGQSSFCPADPPLNAFLANSPWPTYHRNSYRQASTCLPGPTQTDSLLIRAKTQIQGGTSPWVYLSDRYPTGERVLLYSNSTHVFKIIDTGTALETVDSLRIDFDPITSFGWNFLLTNNRVWFTYDPKYDPEENQFTRLLKLVDEEPDDPYSSIIQGDEFNFGDWGINRVQHFALNYEGNIVFNSENDVEQGHATVGILSQNFEVLDTLHYATSADEITHHNAFPIDESNTFYITTNKRILAFGWDGDNLSIRWQTPYDFVGDGPVGTFAEGSGTTPTLLGWGEGNDQLVVMSDGHAQNNLVGFWREVPLDWNGIPGQDIRFAGSIPLPAAVSFSNTFQSIENSPCAFGYSIGIAQFNGFLGYDCENIKGVQKVTWDTEANEFQVDWSTTDVNMNGVLTYSAGTNLVYGSGKEVDCNYYYYGLNWDTGELDLRKLLGPEGTFLNDPFYDAGNGNVIDEEGNIYFAGGASLVKVERVNQSTSRTSQVEDHNPLFYPNPAQDRIFLDPHLPRGGRLSLFNSVGQILLSHSDLHTPIYLENLVPGIYQVVYQKGEYIVNQSLLKKP
ncbi:MAG: T9SS type A sorting domain-containing protein [Bacteroidota bacterium]